MCANNVESGTGTQLFDTHGRRINYIRVSLTDRCNFRCLYCMPPEGQTHIPHAEILSYEELLRFCRISAKLGISRYKITGGEPLCRKDAVPFMRELKKLPGVEQVTLTTNGSALLGQVEALAAMGIDGINVSLDTLSPERYRSITGASCVPENVITAMRAARERGIRIKINTVPIAGHNEADLLNLARFALENGYHLRFIELMPVGQARAYAGVPQEEIRRRIEETFGAMTPLGVRIGNGPAEPFKLAGYSGTIGFISAISKKFCGVCNRVRLTSSGFLKTCLHYDVGREMKHLLRGAASDQEIAAEIVAAVREKPRAHVFEAAPETDGPGAFFMNSVGG